MKAPIWDKPGVEIDERIMRYMAGEDVVLDRVLIAFDILATRAHVAGLADIGVLSAGAATGIQDALDDLEADLASGAFIPDDRFEDGHSAIEWYLVDRLGEDGKRVHLGRSRNDQVLVALRLYMKHALTTGAARCLEAGEAALGVATDRADDPMPGYTHMQRAVPSSVGLWMGSFAEGLTSDAAMLLATRDWLDECPLGTAAGYGVNLDLPRDATSRRLGFDRTLINPMFAQATRGVCEAQVLGAFWLPAQTLRRLAWDLVLFSSAEFGFLRLPDAASTGSSIMPNKRNPDLAELLRGAAPLVTGCISELHALTGLPSGYHRDLQHSKGPLIRGVTATLDALALAPDLINGLQFDTKRMRDAIEPAMHATDRAIDLAVHGMTFRDAYRAVGSTLDQFEATDPMDSLQARVSLGAPGKPGFDRIAARLGAVRSRL